MARLVMVACFVGLATLLSLATASVADETPKKVVLIAGKKSHGPGDHEYERGVKLLKTCLETASNVKGIRAEVVLDGWPRDATVLDDADTIVLYSDGSDRDELAHPILRDDRLATLDRLMKRGVGLVAIHYTVFVPSKKAGDHFLDWIGGYFDYENGSATNHWFSKIQTVTTRVEPASKDHPICRGLSPFDLREEYYYNIRFRPNDNRLVPILEAAIPGEAHAQVVAWAVERANGGRGFGYSGGHFHANWGVDPVRKMVLNAILWTAKADVPEGGVASIVSPEALKIGVTRPARLDAKPDANQSLVIARRRTLQISDR
jgi:type 1 glutamine amidotransferase